MCIDKYVRPQTQSEREMRFDRAVRISLKTLSMVMEKLPPGELYIFFKTVQSHPHAFRWTDIILIKFTGFNQEIRTQ